jgi:hypothetical protein
MKLKVNPLPQGEGKATDPAAGVQASWQSRFEAHRRVKVKQQTLRRGSRPAGSQGLKPTAGRSWSLPQGHI